MKPVAEMTAEEFIDTVMAQIPCSDCNISGCDKECILKTELLARLRGYEAGVKHIPPQVLLDGIEDQPWKAGYQAGIRDMKRIIQSARAGR